jgi:hypothetical protein
VAEAHTALDAVLGNQYRWQHSELEWKKPNVKMPRCIAST